MDIEKDIVVIEFSGLSMEDYQELQEIVKEKFGHKYQELNFFELCKVSK